MHGGQLVAKALKAAGVECVFTLSGGHVMAIYDGCLDEGIKVVDVRHEQAAVHAADAWARLHPGKVGVAIVTAGPGVTDGVTGVANAWRANSPIVVFGGQAPFNNLRRGGLQEMDHVALMKPITKYADTCFETHRVAEYVELAVRHALSGIPGPSFLEIPMDVLGGPVDEKRAIMPTFRDYRVQHAAPRAHAEDAVDLLAGARTPLVMAGTSLKWSEGASQLVEFVESTGLPCYTNGMARGLIPMDHPLFFNRTRAAALRDADVVVLAGTVLDFRMKFGRAIPPGAKIIQLDLDETLIGQNRPADVGLVGNLGANLLQLLDVLAERDIKLDHSAHTAALRIAEDAAEAQLATELTSDEVPIDPLRLCKEIADFVDDEMIVIGDGGDIVAQTSKVLRVPKFGGWMDPGPLGTLGVGMPFALAAQIAHPDRRVLIVYGDGSFGLNGFEFDTAIRFNLPIVGIVGNDAAWGQMLRPQSTVYGPDRLVATKLSYTRYDKIVEAMGGHGEFVTRPEDIRPALERAFASGKAACINVEIRQDVGAMKGSTYA
ncbi:MAG: thiamine pyrophosphate-binding protein [Acidimicrobiales bacterium]